MDIDWTETEVCVDCALIIANDDGSGIEDEAAHRAAMAEHMLPNEVWVIGEGEHAFSSTPCDACGTYLAGTRLDAMVGIEN